MCVKKKIYKECRPYGLNNFDCIYHNRSDLFLYSKWMINNTARIHHAALSKAHTLSASLASDIVSVFRATPNEDSGGALFPGSICHGHVITKTI